jgi:hypothetical protein
VVAYGCLIKRKEARREHLDYIYRALITRHAKVHCNINQKQTYLGVQLCFETRRRKLGSVDNACTVV